MTAFVGLHELEGEPHLQADIAIVGAGAAGITIARELAGSQLRVLLVESGGLELDGATQELMDGESVGLTYEALISARQRFFGGTTNHWTGWCKPLDPIDFAPRPWLGPLATWPFSRAELDPYYLRAAEVCELTLPHYDRARWEEHIGEALDPLDPARFELTFWTRSVPTRFGRRYRDELNAAPNVRVLLEANLVRIGLDPVTGQVDRLDLRHLGGRRARVTARHYVLACGGIENPRLLLASCDARAEGVGNASGWVGRCFMEHTHWSLGEIHAHDPEALLDRYWRQIDAKRLRWLGWRLTDQQQAEQGVVNCHVSLDPLLDKQGYTYAARRLWHGLHNGEIPDDAVSHALSVLGNLGSIARAAWRKKVGRTYVNKPINGILLDVTLDARPVPDSRVTLGEDVDALGMRKPRLDWRLHPEDGQSLTRTAMAVAAEITRLGLGRVQLHPALADPAAAWVESGHLVGHDGAPESPTTFISWHHMGTTRMAADPGQGVVDAHCRVHGVGNLFIAGSSVFPTTGSANPTLTIVALALRLADHLRAASRA